MKDRDAARELGDRVARLAHDAANDLLRVGAALGRLAAREGAGEARDVEREAESSLARAAAALRGIVDLVRGGPEPVDLRERLAEVDPGLARNLPDGPLPLRLSTAEQEILRGVLLEIVRSEGAERLAASVEHGRGRIVLHLDSPAPAFDEAERARRLAPARLRNPASLGGGLALGLGAAVLRRLGGDLRLDAAPGGGRRFTLVLPESVSRPHLRPAPGPRSVLVLEDDPAVARSLALLLESLGHHALAAATVDEARARLDREAVDTLIVDLRLDAGGSGADLVAHVSEHRPDLLPALAVTTGDPGAVPAALAGFPILRKPFGREELRALLGEPDDAADP